MTESGRDEELDSSEPPRVAAVLHEQEHRRDTRRLRPAVWLSSFLFSEYFVLYLSIAYFLIVWPFTRRFAESENIGNIFSNMLPLLAVAVGQTVVLITGGIDLSVTSIIALASITGGWIMNTQTGVLAGSPLAVPVGILAMLAVGLVVGLLNGLAISRLMMPPFIVTLTTMMFFSGLAIWLTQSRSIYHLPGSFIAIGTGGVGIVPYALLVTGLLSLLIHVMLKKTTWGHWLYAIGHNTKTATISGVPVEWTIVLAYVISGICAAVASILYTARLETGLPVMGQHMLLDVIGAVVIGGTSLFGGKGKIQWTIFGVLLIVTIDNSLNMQGLSYFAIMIAKGSVILFAAFIDAMRHRWARV